MGAEASMLRSRRKPGRCPVEGQDDGCEMAGERPQRERHDEVVAVGRDVGTGLADAHHERGGTA